MYEQKMCYIDLYRNGVKCGNMGHVRMEWDGDRYRFGASLCHMDRQTLVTAVLERAGGRPRSTIQNIAIIHGKGSAQFDWTPIEGNEESLLFQASGEVYGICRLPKMREILELEASDAGEAAPKAMASDSTDAIEHDTLPTAVEAAKTAQAEPEGIKQMATLQAGPQSVKQETVKQAGLKSVKQETALRAEPERVRQKAELQAEPKSMKQDMALQVESKSVKQETALQDESERVKQETALQAESEHVKQETALQDESEHVRQDTLQNEAEHADEKSEAERDFLAEQPEEAKAKTRKQDEACAASALTYPQGSEERRRREQHVTTLSDDKWKQLCSIYPNVHPIGEDVDFVEITPADFVILRQEYQNLVRNSFLLHGYYNYNHVLLGKYPDKYYIGVPGIMHEQERIAAAMFGFVGFERAKAPKEQKEARDQFGYYMMEVGI